MGWFIIPASSNRCQKEEMVWLFKVQVGMTEGRERCTKQSVQNAKRSVKFLLNPAVAGRFTVKSATQGKKIAVVN